MTFRLTISRNDRTMMCDETKSYDESWMKMIRYIRKRTFRCILESEFIIHQIDENSRVDTKERPQHKFKSYVVAQLKYDDAIKRYKKQIEQSKRFLKPLLED